MGCVPDHPQLPATFRAYVVDKPADGAFSRGLREFATADLPQGEVTVRVEWSSVNFKDGLAAREDGRVARAYPADPGHRPRGRGRRERGRGRSPSA